MFYYFHNLFDLFNNRKQFITKCWSRLMRIHKQDFSLPDIAFSEALEQAACRLVPCDMSDQISKLEDMNRTMAGFIYNEAKRYFETGNCEMGDAGKASVNPTLLELTTGRWFVNYIR